jgi:hypothetical protein
MTKSKTHQNTKPISLPPVLFVFFFFFFLITKNIFVATAIGVCVLVVGGWWGGGGGGGVVLCTHFLEPLAVSIWVGAGEVIAHLCREIEG